MTSRFQPEHAVGLLALVAAAIIVTLGGTFSAVGLAAAEGRADVATLAAVGASPGLRRRLAAAQAGVITVLGAALGLVTGLVAGWALVRLRGPDAGADGAAAYLVGWDFVVPWPWVAAVVVAVPLLAIGVGFLGTRSQLPLIRRMGQ